MGLRHAEGLAAGEEVSEICLVDKREEALLEAQEVLSKNPSAHKFQFCHLSEMGSKEFDLGIVASTASDRLGTAKEVIGTGIKYLLIEKPLGQSMEEVRTLVEYLAGQNVLSSVNLNMRLYESFAKLKEDLNSLPQFAGPKVITANTGSIGIGANGIHYLDLLYFLLGADRAELICGEIEPELIPSPRGPEFDDFGGWCNLSFYDQDQYLGRAHLSLSANSTVFGGWDIVGSHARIRLDEMEQTRIDILREENSVLPMYRYGGDYQKPVVREIVSPPLGDLTLAWLRSVIQNQSLLPDLQESVRVHDLLFRWLALGKEHKEMYPIT